MNDHFSKDFLLEPYDKNEETGITMSPFLKIALVLFALLFTTADSSRLSAIPINILKNGLPGEEMEAGGRGNQDLYGVIIPGAPMIPIPLSMPSKCRHYHTPCSRSATIIQTMAAIATTTATPHRKMNMSITIPSQERASTRTWSQRVKRRAIG